MHSIHRKNWASCFIREGGRSNLLSICGLLLMLLCEETLDSQTSAEIMNVFEGLAAHGQTVIMVTHDAGAASTADRVVMLQDGAIVHDGPAESADALLDLMKQVA